MSDSGTNAVGPADIPGVEVEVAYATPEFQRIIRLRVPIGTSAWDAVRQSGIAEEFPEIDLESAVMGIFSRKLDGRRAPTPQDYALKPRDRVEIYRPLRADPKQTRKLRAAKTTRERTGAHTFHPGR